MTRIRLVLAAFAALVASQPSRRGGTRNAAMRLQGRRQARPAGCRLRRNRALGARDHPRWPDMALSGWGDRPPGSGDRDGRRSRAGRAIRHQCGPAGSRLASAGPTTERPAIWPISTRSLSRTQPSDASGARSGISPSGEGGRRRDRMTRAEAGRAGPAPTGPLKPATPPPPSADAPARPRAPSGHSPGLGACRRNSRCRPACRNGHGRRG